MFCDVELAARIERAECRLIAEACANVARRIAGTSVTPIGGGMAVFAEPGSPLNKLAGLGFGEVRRGPDGPLKFDEAAFLAIEQDHAARRAPLQVELATLADPALGKWLTGRGYELVGVENVLGRSLPIDREAGVELGEDIELAESSDAEFDTWVDAIVEGFLSTDEQGVPTHEHFEREMVDTTIRDFNRSPSLVRYLARREGRAAGGAVMRVSDGIAQLCGASTRFEHRRRGIQSALLERRLLDAGARGCTVATATTLPGSKSQQNMQRQGFALLYSRNVLRLEPR